MRTSARLLAVTRQLIGVPWTGARPLVLGLNRPCRACADLQDQFQRIGQCLANDFSLRGLFGVDAIVNARGVWPVEVNPRYTASIELIERQRQISLIPWHRAACCEDGPERCHSTERRERGEKSFFMRDEPSASKAASPTS